MGCSVCGCQWLCVGVGVSPYCSKQPFCVGIIARWHSDSVLHNLCQDVCYLLCTCSEKHAMLWGRALAMAYCNGRVSVVVKQMYTCIAVTGRVLWYSIYCTRRLFCRHSCTLSTIAFHVTFATYTHTCTCTCV